MSPLDIIGIPLVAGLLVVASHVPLGREVLRRGIVFIDLAVAQVAALGVVVAHAAGLAHGAIGVQAAAVGAALAAAGLLTWSDRRWPQLQEALIGVLFVLAASLGILVLAGDPRGGEQLRDSLAGQILWIGARDLPVIAGVNAAVLVLWIALRERLGRIGFYGLFSLAVTASVQVVGVYLVFATLIVPALVARLAGSGKGLSCGYAVAAVGYALGLASSAAFDLPAGSAVVCALVLAGAVAALILRLGRGRGFIDRQSPADRGMDP